MAALSIRRIQTEVGRLYGLSRDDLLSLRYAAPRQMAILLAWENTESTNAEIGRAFRRDAKTVHHACWRASMNVLEHVEWAQVYWSLSKQMELYKG